MIVRKMEKGDRETFSRLFNEAYTEYEESLRCKDPAQYPKVRQEKMEVSDARFDFYLGTGSSFVAEEAGRVVGYVASQTVPFMHGVDKLLWIEYIVAQSSFRRRGIGLALLRKLIDFARDSGADRAYTTINPDNEASRRLHTRAGFSVKDWMIASYRIE